MKRYFLSDGMTDLEVEVAENTDFDDQFEAWCIDTGERLLINGWNLVDIEELVA
jgi:hypothetical protein